MSRPVVRAYSHYTRDTLMLLGKLIQRKRKERKLTKQKLAERSGISRGLLQRIENGNPKCEIGVVFETAAIVGVTLFNTDHKTIKQHLRQTEDILALLPASIRESKRDFDDDF